MACSRHASALVCAALSSVFFVIGCGDPGLSPQGDAGTPLGDGGITLPDARVPGDDAATSGCRSSLECDDGLRATSDTCVDGRCQHDATACTSDWECADFDACTSDTCGLDGVCAFTPIPDCAGCRSDAECDDADPTTTDVCDTFRRACSHRPNDPTCRTGADCDDGNPCTSDQCNGGLCAWGSIGTCCFRDTDCDDHDPCTAETCDTSANACSVTPIPDCGSTCPDFDRDGYGSIYCFPSGGDCDDTNAAVHPGATELCDDGIDDDCDGQTDLVDETCASHNTTCAGATMLAAPGTTHGSVVSMTTTGGPTGTCGASAFFTFAVTETSDVDLTIRLGDLPAGPTCPGCPPSNEMHQIWHDVIVETACGDATTAVAELGGGGGCYIWDPSGGFFGGQRERTLTMRRLAAGTYTVEVQARDWPGFSTIAIPFDLTLHATPSEGAMCSGEALVAGGVVNGTTEGGTDAFGLACDGSPFAAPEVLHGFDVPTRSRVRLLATPAVPASGNAPGVQLALRTACDPDTAPSACVDTTGYACHATASLEQILEPGHYFAEIQGRDAPTPYALSLELEEVGAACTGATPIRASGSFMGDTTGRPDHFRWNDVCGGGEAGEVVFSLEVAVSSRVVLDLISSAASPVLRVVSGCGATLVAGREGSTHVDRTFDPGTYEVVVDGGGASDVGSFVLNATLLPR